MKRITGLAIALFLTSVAVPGLAGKGEKCTADAQTCLNHFSLYKEKGWHGLKYEANDKGDLVVKSVVVGSPAEKSGFQAGDILVSLNGAKMTDKEAVKKAKGEWKTGSQVTYSVLRGGAEQQIAVTLAPMPEEVYAGMVGQHMIESHMAVASTTTAESKKN
jgi:S1-C subfamily serine protease